MTENKKVIRKKGEKMLAILDVLLGVSCNAVAMFLAVSSGERTVAGMERVFHRLKPDDHRLLRDLVDDVKELNRFYCLLSSLKRQGLIYQSEGKLSITKKGIAKLMSLRGQMIYQKKYKIKPSKERTIVIFDIPEIERRKRCWVRMVLSDMGFKMLQKSVWLGNGQLPDEFIKDLRKLKLEPFIHIFSVNKQGTI